MLYFWCFVTALSNISISASKSSVLIISISLAGSTLFSTICGKTECELQDLSEEEAKEYLQTLGMERSGLDSLIKSGYDLLGLITLL